MPARAAVHSLIEDDAGLILLGVQKVYAANAVDTPDEECFLVVKWDMMTAVFKTRGYSTCSIWAHDKNRDYGRINAVLHRIEDLLTDTVHRDGADGWTLTLAEWRGQGPDLVDDGYGTVARYSDFVVVSRYTTI